MGKIRFCLFLMCFGFYGVAFSQHTYAVHFKHKPHDNLTFEDPQAFLSPKAIDRRAKQGIAIDSLDLPVSPTYIEGIRPFVEEFLYQVSWLNASLATISEDHIGDIENLAYVDKVVLVSPNLGKGDKAIQKIKKGLQFKINLKGNRTNEEVYTFQNGVLGIDEMHALGFKGEGMLIAVFDAGFPGVDTIDGLRHLVDNNQIVAIKDFVTLSNDNVFTKHQHGTNVLSLIAANKEESLVSGAPEASYILCITEDNDSEYRIEEYNWVKAAAFADSLGVDVINSSLGYFDFDDSEMDYGVEDLDGNSAVISQGAAIAGTKGILVVNSAGNYGRSGASTLTAPADARGILTIGATNTSGEMAAFSSQGPTADGRIKPDLSTFGEGVYLFRSNGAVNRANGTSFSSPQIAALAAGLWQAKPEWSKDELITALLESATQADAPDNRLGHGIPNFHYAYYGKVLDIENPKEEEVWKVYPNPISGNTLNVVFGSEFIATYVIKTLSGQMVLEGRMLRDRIDKPYEIELPLLSQGVYMIEAQSGSTIKRTKLIKR
ncbi:S8 family serine peptidase [Belliella sp. DSM 111904]|uniref:S8 family serine peptidase n=1 Tax=Belliella filtrata TaxID=2923435 RepID=A0ABS9UW34_9BACT|nr:S8 family serine peptidase [Belliella filtrata]MCH7408366.1 S8 family serine peptidase [Belliella filtrata]